MSAYDASISPVEQGGTGRRTLAVHGVVIGGGSGAVSVTSAGVTGQVLTSNGPNADPTFQGSGIDAQTAVAGAATSSKAHVVVTSEALVAATAYSLALTDALIKAASVIQVTAFNNVATGVQVKKITPGDGSATIDLAFAAYTGALTINVSIFN